MSLLVANKDCSGIYAKKDVIGVAATGAGKTLSFWIALLSLDGFGRERIRWFLLWPLSTYWESRMSKTRSIPPASLLCEGRYHRMTFSSLMSMITTSINVVWKSVICDRIRLSVWRVSVICNCTRKGCHNEGVLIMFILITWDYISSFLAPILGFVWDHRDHRDPLLPAPHTRVWGKFCLFGLYFVSFGLMKKLMDKTSPNSRVEGLVLGACYCDWCGTERQT